MSPDLLSEKPLDELIYLDQRTVTPCLAPYEMIEIEQAVALLNTISKRKINLARTMSEEQAKVCVVVIETWRAMRTRAVRFGVEMSAQAVKGSATLSQARQNLANLADSPELA